MMLSWHLGFSELFIFTLLQIKFSRATNFTDLKNLDRKM
jgi:hypothetical protein